VLIKLNEKQTNREKSDYLIFTVSLTGCNWCWW